MIAIIENIYFINQYTSIGTGSGNMKFAGMRKNQELFIKIQNCQFCTTLNGLSHWTGF